MGIIDDVTKIIGSFKPVDIKTEIKNPTISPTVNYKSPTTNINFQSVEIGSSQVDSFVDKISDKVIEGIKKQAIGSVATDNEIQNEISKLTPGQFPAYLKSAVAGTATIAQMQPDFITAGTTLFPEPGQVFKVGEAGLNGKKVNNLRIIRHPDNTVTISYDEA